MKKTAKFESLQDAKFRTLESKELKSLTGGLVMDMSLNTLTIYGDNTTADDGKDKLETE